MDLGRDRLKPEADLKLAMFERVIMAEPDDYKVRECAVRLYAQTLHQRAVYESLLKSQLSEVAPGTSKALP